MTIIAEITNMPLIATRCYEYMITPLKRIWVSNNHHIKIQDGSTFKMTDTEVMISKKMFTGKAKLLRK